MARDCDKQYIGKAGHLTVDCGYDTFSGSDTTKEVSTFLTTIVAAVVTAKSASTGGIVELSCDNTVTGGAVTVTRTIQADTGGSAAVTSAQTFNYIFIGV